MGSRCDAEVLRFSLMLRLHGLKVTRDCHIPGRLSMFRNPVLLYLAGFISEAFSPWSQTYKWEFPKIRVPYLGVLIIRILLFRVRF